MESSFKQTEEKENSPTYKMKVCLGNDLILKMKKMKKTRGMLIWTFYFWFSMIYLWKILNWIVVLNVIMWILNVSGLAQFVINFNLKLAPMVRESFIVGWRIGEDEVSVKILFWVHKFQRKMVHSSWDLKRAWDYIGESSKPFGQFFRASTVWS